MRRFVLFAVLAASAVGASLSGRIEAALASTPAARQTFWGVKVVSLANGRTLFETNAQRFFVPASNTKLFTTALALVRLGPDYRFQTTVRGPAPDAAGTVAGGLRLIGGGDPLLSGRVTPYQKGQASGNPLEAIEALAEQVYARGVRRIEGDVAGDDTAYVWAPYPEGWAMEDGLWSDGAPVSALAVNDNVFTLTLRAGGKAGRPPSVSLSPPIEFYSIDNRVRTGPGLENRVRVERLPGSRQVRLWGTLSTSPPGSVSFLLSVDDPALYAAQALADALTRRGVAIAGRPVAKHRFANQRAGVPFLDGVELARRESPPLIELLRIIDKVSQNLHAEMTLREVARSRRGAGRPEDGLEELRAFLIENGAPPSEVQLRDGSGLSQNGLTTPSAIVRLLQAMYRSPRRAQWISLLPIGGEDGTLNGRFRGRAAARRIHAKTGSLSRVAALSGYVESKSRGWLAFSILANNYTAPGAEIRDVIDKVALILAE